MLATLSVGLFAGCSGGPPPGVDAGDGRLAPCPSTPNCVSTLATDGEHAIEPLPFRGSAADTMTALRAVVQRMPRTKVITERDDYLHVEYRTRVGFVDDVEFLLDMPTRTVNFRSASRVGTSDLGLNRQRMEEFTELYVALSDDEIHDTPPAQ